MSKAQSYQGRAKETYRFQLKSDESIISIENDSDGDIVTESSSIVSEEKDSYGQINSKPILSNDELFKLLSNDRRFIQSCKDHNITRDDQELLKNNFKQYIEKYTTFTQREIDFINEKKGLLAEAQDMAPDNSHLVQMATTGKAGAAAYLSSFMLGKLATNIVTTGTGSSHGVWPFLLIAGLLNPLLSEPIANAIRLQGAHHPSPDGRAYMDFNSVLQELRLAEENDQTERINQCHELINKIVAECIEREKLMHYLKSGVDSIKDEDINDLTKLCGKSGNVQKVIDAAQRRAFVTDELPFFCFTLLYTVTGGCSPLIKQSFPPVYAATIDFFANAAAGAMAGAATGILQNYSRSGIQQSTLQNLSSAIKGAQLALAGVQRDAWNEKHINLKKLLEVLRLERDKLQKLLEQDSEEDRLEKINELIHDLKIKTKDAEKKWKQARSIHHQHDSYYRRIKTAVLASGKSYMGEVSNKDQPGLLEGVPAQATMCAKLIAAPISLVANCGYIALGIPALLNLVSDTVINVLSTNSTDLGGIGNETHAYPNDPSGVINFGAVALSTAVGLPLIAGYITRYQLLHPTIQYWIRPLFGAVNIETNSANNGQKDTVVDMKKILESRRDDSSSEVEESVAKVDRQSSPNTRREINKLNELVKQAKGSSYRNIDGRASDDSATDDMVEPSESSSSTV
jgi:hypothetical protein